MRKRRALFLLPALFAIAALAQTRPGKTVWDGAYSAEQVKRGEAAYTASCAGCHGGDLSGKNAAPPLKGPDFMERWREYDLEPLFTLIKTYMPRNAPKLGDPAYLDIVSYILQGNGFPAGKDELKLDTLEHIQLVGKDGPKPVPGGSLVQSAGCLVQTQDNLWMMIDATEPLRAKNSDKITPQELRESEAMPPGPQKYRLVNFDYIAPDFQPADYLDQRILVKGYLIRQPNAERINLTALGKVAATCG